MLRDCFVGVDFSHFKAFDRFSIELRQFNILVGPNNAGKSTILAAFRILAAAMRKAESRRPQLVHGPNGTVTGYLVDLSGLAVAEENIFYNYEDDEAALVTFRLASKNSLTLYFPEQGTCYHLPVAQGKIISSPTVFKRCFPCSVGFVPILGPVDHHEPLYKPEAARLALFNYGAARNFRNIWWHFPEKFPDFREAIRRTWPGMDIERPEAGPSHERTLLHMYCPEERIPREIFWAGFGFQVWCQMLTHLVQSSGKSMFLIDEPDIYLHSDLQRQLLGLLRDLGPDILIATHSTEIITEAETNDIVLVDKKRNAAKRIRDPAQLASVFRTLGSNLNPVLTQLAKTRRVVFVEGKDFQIVGRFASKVGARRVGNRSDFAVVPVEGFNPERIKNLKAGMEATLGTPIIGAAILDRDYRSDAECESIKRSTEGFCSFVHIHSCKELENFLLVPEAIDRAALARVTDRSRRTGTKNQYDPIAVDTLNAFATDNRNYVTAQYVAASRRFHRSASPKKHEEVVTQDVLEELEREWGDASGHLRLIPGKEALSAVNAKLQAKYQVSVTPTAIVDAMKSAEVPEEMCAIVAKLAEFAVKEVDG